MNKKLKIVLLVIAIIFISLASLVWSKIRPIDLDDVPELRDRIHRYYTFEKAGEWNNAYYFRTPLYRTTVSLENYIKSMSEDNEGWGLLDYEIVGARKIGDEKVKVKIKFHEKMASSFAEKLGLDVDKGLFDSEQETKWKIIDGVWYCVDAGSRMHLPMNSMIVVE
jgi:hypothetical protein